MDVRVYSFRTTIPQGSWQWTNNEITPFRLVYTFDFFNYAGIHRPVVLYTKPKEVSVSDVTVFAQSINVENHSAVLKYHVEVESVGDQAGREHSFSRVLSKNFFLYAIQKSFLEQTLLKIWTGKVCFH